MMLGIMLCWLLMKDELLKVAIGSWQPQHFQPLKAVKHSNRISALEVVFVFIMFMIMQNCKI